MPLNLIQMIIGRASGEKEPLPGQVHVVSVDAVMISEALGPPFFTEQFEALDARLFDPDKVVVIIDHYSPAATIHQAEHNRITQQWVRRTGARHFFMHCGPNPQVMAEQGFFQPGTIVVGNDSHTCTGGAFGALAFGVGSTEIACTAATGKIWLKVPETIRISWQGDLADHLSAKDMALFMTGHFGSTDLIYKALEFDGECIDSLSIDGRMTLANLTVEMGAKAGLFNPDHKARKAAAARADKGHWDLKADEGAPYENDVTFSTAALEPMAAVPHHVDQVRPVKRLKDVKIDQAYIGSCTGGRYEDLLAAVRILKERKVADGVRLMVSPASKWIWERADREGILLVLSQAGAVVSYPSCGPCGGAQGGLLAEGEVCVAASNRNFKGRMGSPEAEIYLTSPATVAASAITGRITDPREILEP
jgi:3-isopropylmalate/(R)-2-methylmalate dehydratase large subunit